MPFRRSLGRIHRIRFASAGCTPGAVRRGLTPRFNRDAHGNILIKFIEHRHEPVDGEAGEPRLADTREIGSRKARFVGAANADTPIVQHGNDLRRKDSLELLYLGIGVTKVAKDIAAAVHQFEIVFADCKASFSRLMRSPMRSSSVCGVLIPVFDFF